jgi:D-arabinose 1-dehydrogenase-like Zn-dependent alcohol dehydrogenase
MTAPTFTLSETPHQTTAELEANTSYSLIPNGSRELHMKRVQYLHYGGPDELRLDEVTPPDPERGQVRVQVRAASVNPMDRKIRGGEMRMLSGFRFPRGLGHDFAGVVEAVGPDVKGLKVGTGSPLAG